MASDLFSFSKGSVARVEKWEAMTEKLNQANKLYEAIEIVVTWNS